MEDLGGAAPRINAHPHIFTLQVDMEDLGGAAPKKREKKGAGSADATGKGESEGSAPRATAPEMLTPLVRNIPLLTLLAPYSPTPTCGTSPGPSPPPEPCTLIESHPEP